MALEGRRRAGLLIIRSSRCLHFKDLVSHQLPKIRGGLPSSGTLRVRVEIFFAFLKLVDSLNQVVGLCNLVCLVDLAEDLLGVHGVSKLTLLFLKFKVYFLVRHVALRLVGCYFVQAVLGARRLL